MLFVPTEIWTIELIVVVRVQLPSINFPTRSNLIYEDNTIWRFYHKVWIIVLLKQFI